MATSDLRVLGKLVAELNRWGKTVRGKEFNFGFAVGTGFGAVVIVFAQIIAFALLIALSML